MHADPQPPADASLMLRPPTAMEQLEVGALARRLGEPVPAQPILVAVRDGRVVAARSVPTGILLLDPGAVDRRSPTRGGRRRG